MGLVWGCLFCSYYRRTFLASVIYIYISRMGGTTPPIAGWFFFVDKLILYGPIVNPYMDLQYEQVEKNQSITFFFFLPSKLRPSFFSENLVSRYRPIFVTYSSSPKYTKIHQKSKNHPRKSDLSDPFQSSSYPTSWLSRVVWGCLRPFLTDFWFFEILAPTYTL